MYFIRKVCQYSTSMTKFLMRTARVNRDTDGGRSSVNGRRRRTTRYMPTNNRQHLSTLVSRSITNQYVHHTPRWYKPHITATGRSRQLNSVSLRFAPYIAASRGSAFGSVATNTGCTVDSITRTPPTSREDYSLTWYFILAPVSTPTAPTHPPASDKTRPPTLTGEAKGPLIAQNVVP